MQKKSVLNNTLCPSRILLLFTSLNIVITVTELSKIITIAPEILPHMNIKKTLFKKCTKIITYSFLVVLLLSFVGFASAADYYVSTEGSNENNGLTLDTAWTTPSYAATKVVSGDTIYLVNCTWYEEKIHFSNNGTEEKPITIKAYNGTPTLDGIVGAVSSSDRGLDITNSEHIVIRGLKVLNYTHPLYIRSSNNISVYDSEFSNSIGGFTVGIANTDTYHTLIDNCSIHNSGWNAIQIQGNRELPNGNGIASEYITVTNNTIYNNSKHGHIDLYGNIKHVLIKDNVMYNSKYTGIYSHSVTDSQWNITIINNTIYNCSYGMKFENLHNSNIVSNEIYDIDAYGIYTGIGSDNITFCENNISAQDYAFQVGDSNLTLARNKLNDNIVYRLNEDGLFTLEDAIDNYYNIYLTKGANTTVKYTTNQVFTIQSIRSDSTYEISDIWYKCDKSELVIKSNPNGSLLACIQKYPFYIRPINQPLKVTSANNTTLQLHSDLIDNPVWISVDLSEYSDSSVIMLVDGKPYEYETANKVGLVTFYYNETWNTDHIFTFEKNPLNSSEDLFNTTISGYVESSSGFPIPDAFVFNNVTNEIVTTDPNGHYNLNIPTNNNVKITAAKEGYYSSSFSVKVGEKDISNANLVLNKEETEDSTHVKISQSNRFITPNQPFTIEVSINPDTAITGAQFNLLFDSSMVSADSVTEGNLLNQDGAETLFNCGTINNSSGTVTDVYGSILGKSNVSSEGVMATITMTAGSVTGITELKLSNVIVSDSDSKAAPITISNATVLIDTAPVLNSIGPKSVSETNTLNFAVDASDADGDELTYSATGLPDGANIDPATGVFTWVPAPGQTGVYTATFEVSDGYLSDSEDVSITVNPANNVPVIDSFEPESGASFKEKDKINILVSAFDLDGQFLNYIIKINGVTCSTEPTYIWKTDFSSSGEYTVEVTVSDGVDQVTEQHTIYVNDYHPEWDVNKDWKVDILDIATVAQEIGTTTTEPYPRWDVNQDGEVNIQDLSIVGYHFGEKIE